MAIFESKISATALAEIIHTSYYGFLTRAKNANTLTHELMVLFLQSLKK